MINWTTLTSGPFLAYAHVGPFRLEVFDTEDGHFGCDVEHRLGALPRDHWREYRPDIESGKAACEAKAIEWIREERDELNEALRALGVKP